MLSENAGWKDRVKICSVTSGCGLFCHYLLPACSVHHESAFSNYFFRTWAGSGISAEGLWGDSQLPWGCHAARSAVRNSGPCAQSLQDKAELDPWWCLPVPRHPFFLHIQCHSCWGTSYSLEQAFVKMSNAHAYQLHPWWLWVNSVVNECRK